MWRKREGCDSEVWRKGRDSGVIVRCVEGGACGLREVCDIV